MVYFCYSSSLNVCVAYRLHLFVLDSLLATLLERNCPFGFLLVMFPSGSSYSWLCFFPFDVSGGRYEIIVSIPDYCLPFYFGISIDFSFRYIKDIILVVYSLFSIAITSLGEEKVCLGAFRTFVRFALVCFCLL